jgi:hypothetical protein
MPTNGFKVHHAFNSPHPQIPCSKLSLPLLATMEQLWPKRLSNLLSSYDQWPKKLSNLVSSYDQRPKSFNNLLSSYDQRPKKLSNLVSNYDQRNSTTSYYNVHSETSCCKVHWDERRNMQCGLGDFPLQSTLGWETQERGHHLHPNMAAPNIVYNIRV